MTNDKLKRVARALYAEMGALALEVGSDAPPPFDDSDKDATDFCRRLAQAAIAACEAEAGERERKLVAALKLCVPIIEGERQVLIDSYKQLSGKYKGQVIDREAKKDIARMDRALELARAAGEGEVG